MWWVVIVGIAIWIILVVKPYFIRYDTVVGFTGGLGAGKSFESVNCAIRELKKNRFRTNVYNFIRRIFRRSTVEKPLLYSSIPIRISRREYAEKLTEEQLLLQERFVKGSIVFIDEVDVWANQFAHANPNIIETLSKREIQKDDFVEGGIFDEHIRLFRHLHSSPCCEPKLIVNTQATSNIITVIRRRINTVFCQARFRVIKVPILCHLPIIKYFTQFYTYIVRNITITDEITNTNDGNFEDGCRRVIGIMPFIRHYDTHCYSERSKPLEQSEENTWNGLKTTRLLKCPLKKKENKCNQYELN